METTTMNNDHTVAAASAVVDMPQLDHSAEVAAAFLDGGKAATDRLFNVFSAEGIKGNAARMFAALDIVRRSTDMSCAAIAAFVVKYVDTPPTVENADASYSARRAAAAESEERWTLERQEMARQRNSAARAGSDVEDDSAPDGPDAA